MPRSCLITLLAFIVCPAIVSAQSDDQHFTSHREPIGGTSPYTNIVFRNTGVDTFVVDSVQLNSCRNLQEGCQIYRPKTIVAPGRVVTAMRVSAQARNLPYEFSYHYWYTVRPANESTGDQAVRQVMKNDVTSATAVPERRAGYASATSAVVQPITDAALFTPLVPPTPEKDKGDCNSVTGGISQPGDRTMAMSWVSGRSILRTVLVEFDTAWKVYRYEDNRNLPRTDNLAGPSLVRTTINIRGASGSAMLWNINNTEAELYRLTGTDMLRASSLGVPADIIAQVMKRCGKHNPPATVELIAAAEAPSPAQPTVKTSPAQPIVTTSPTLSPSTLAPAGGSNTTAPAYHAPPSDGRVGTTTLSQSTPVTLRTITDPSLFVARVPIAPGTGICTREPAIVAPAGRMQYGMAWTSENNVLLRRITVVVDAAQKPISFIDSRYGVIPTDAPPGTEQPRTVIKITLGAQQASLMNVGGTQKAEGFSLYEGNVMSEQALGDPASMTKTIVNACRGGR